MGHMAITLALLIALCAALALEADARHHLLTKPHRQMQTSYTCIDTYGEDPITFFFFADPGDFSGSTEAKWVLHNMKDVEIVTLFKAHCGQAFTGMCTQSVLDKCGSHVSEAIYMGTSAFPSVVGGVLQPSPSCDEPNQATDCESVIRVGDVCITPYAVNWDCKQADWSQHFFGSTNWDAKVNNLCWLPEETFGVDASFLYGECMFYDVPPGTHELVDELYAAANSNVAKDVTRQRSKAQLEYDHEYWTMMKEGLDLDYYMFKKGDNAFKTFTNCVEVDSQFFFSGPPYEATCRNLSAHVLNLATNSSDFASTDVVFANAMEGIGFNKAIMAYNKYSTRPIPFVNMRGASNYNHMPVANGPIAGTYVYAEPQLKPDFSAGYSTAIDNYSAVILALWQARCLAGVSESKKDKCNFSLQAGG